MIAELYDSVAGTAVHVNSDYVVSVRPDPEDPLHQSIVKLKDGETVRIRGDHDEVAAKLDGGS